MSRIFRQKVIIFFFSQSCQRVSQTFHFKRVRWNCVVNKQGKKKKEGKNSSMKKQIFILYFPYIRLCPRSQSQSPLGYVAAALFLQFLFTVSLYFYFNYIFLSPLCPIPSALTIFHFRAFRFFFLFLTYTQRQLRRAQSAIIRVMSIIFNSETQREFLNQSWTSVHSYLLNIFLYSSLLSKTK